MSPSLDAGVRITTRSGGLITAQVAGLDVLVGAGYQVVCCERLGVEGLVHKQLAAPHRPGRRSPAGRKVK